MDFNYSPGPTPTLSGIEQRPGTFSTLPDALDYAAGGETGLNFYSVRGELTEALPYRILQAEAIELAQKLIARGLKRDDPVALIAETTPDFVRIFFACQYAGLVPVPLPVPSAFGGRAPFVAQIGRLIAEAKATALFAPKALMDWLSPVADEQGLALCSTIADLADGPDADVELPVIGPDDTAYLQFSSGSTRFPIGVVIKQRALMANASAMLRHGLEIRPEDRAVSWLPLYHDMGLVGFLLGPVSGQVTVDLLSTQDFARRPQLWLSLISSGGGTISYSPSFGYDLCVRRARQASGLNLDLSCWRVAGIGGDMIRPAVLDIFASTFAPLGFDAGAFLPSYGMAEATLAISFAPIGRGFETDTIDLDVMEQDGIIQAPADEHARTRTVVLCGVALPDHQIEIRDDDGVPLADRRVGRIFARGASVMQGYNGRPDETSLNLSVDGWLATGDLGYNLGKTLVVTGRAKDLIIINGRNIWPQDLEWTVEKTVPKVRTGDVAAFSVDEDGNEVLIIAVEGRDVSDPVDSRRLVEEIGGAVREQHGLDCRVILLMPGSLSYTSSGKLSRSLTRQHYLAEKLPRVLLSP